MAEATRASGTEVWAYCLMPNHIHMVMMPAAEDGLRASLGEAHRRYTRYINFRESWRGHLWQERFHKVGPMLDRVADWSMYLASDGDTCDELLDRYSRTGRPLGDEHFVSKLESLTGAVLARKQPGRKPNGSGK